MEWKASMSEYKDRGSWWFALLISSLSWLPIVILLPFGYFHQEGWGFLITFAIIIPIWPLCFNKIGFHDQMRSDLRMKKKLSNDIQRMSKEYPELRFTTVNNEATE